MKALFYSLALLFSITVSAQAPVYYQHTEKDSIPIYPFAISGVDTAVKVNFDLIDEATFAIFERTYFPQFDEDSTKVQWLDTTFVVKTNSSEFTFQYRKKDGQWDITLHDYLGYIKQLNLYTIEWVNSPNEVSGLTLINKTTGKQYLLEGFDNAPEVPLVSPDGNMVIVWSSDIYEKSGSYVNLFGVNRGKDGIVLNGLWATESNPVEYPDMTPEETARYAANQDLWSFVEVADTLPENETVDPTIDYNDYSPMFITKLVWVGNDAFAFETVRTNYTSSGLLRSKPLYIKATITR